MAATTMAFTALAFDATSFPHLIDMILSVAPLGALLKMRQTSHAFEDRVNKVFARKGVHMVLTPHKYTGYECAFRDGKSIVFPLCRAMMISLAPFTRVLDFDDNIKKDALELVLRRCDFDALEMTRVLNHTGATGYYPFFSPTYVMSIEAFGPVSHEETAPTMNPYPPGTQKVVINVATSGRYRNPSLSPSQVGLFNCQGGSFDEMVVIYSEPGGLSPSHPRRHPKERQYLYRVLQQYMLRTIISFTQVNAGFLAERTRPLQVTTDETHEVMGEEGLLLLLDEAEARGLDNKEVAYYRYRRGDQYRAEVGDTLFALETMATE